MDLNDFAVGAAYEDGFTLMLSEDCGVKLRAAGSDKAQKVRERLWEPYSSFREIPDGIRAKLNARWIAEGLVVEWVGPWKVDGKPLPTDVAEVAKILARPALKPLATRLLQASLNDENFRAGKEAAAEKN
ncbi:hypothetical protein [Roseospira visakhapatnamensis]|uniref:Uncharacterized protein n=1 Tax=Roseospira visakhapatnamensis TaxID=390880 RepID=A0A7W6RG75_9PROT|nr:hypothetical protein [Roseospira visakhapatnamensis]MBB4267732.1 hypothetical protein [Roseospira visakhapatnamensis]